jgi:adenine-specific DNA-methyltransferase
VPTLDWLNRAAAFDIAKNVPYRLLEAVSEHRANVTAPDVKAPFNKGVMAEIAESRSDLFSALEPTLNKADSEKSLLPTEQVNAPATQDNLLIQGDNLEALKALLPFYRGQVKCIFIDPPYNTGSAFEHYDDNLEHSQWLTLMCPRLQLLRELLSDDGFICTHIDDSEGHYLKVLMDQIFGRENYVVSLYPIVRYADKTLKQDMDFHKRVEQLHVYRKTRSAKPIRPRETVSYDKYVFKISELAAPKVIQIGGKSVQVFSKGSWKVEATEPSVDALKEIWATGTILDGNSSGRFFRDYLTGRVNEDGLGALYRVEGIGDDELPYRYFTGPQKATATKGKYFQGVPMSKRVATSDESYPIDNSYDFAAAFGNCRTEGDVDFRAGKKPELYLQTLLNYFSKAGDLVLDSFLGSGTTAATAHKMRRRWIGIELREQATTHCLPRLQKVLDGEQGGISKAVNWQGGGSFRFMQLGAPVFDEKGAIHPAVRFATLAAFIWMQETGTPITSQPAQASPTAYLGTHHGVDYFLLFNGVLGDRRPQSGNVLTRAVLDWLTVQFPSDGRPRVVYGEANRLGAERLTAARVQFKSLPHDVVNR